MQADDFQIVFVNDGSSDSGGEICRALADKHSNVTYFEKENGGVSSARNKGIELAEGKYIMFLDADDTLSNNCLQAVYNFFEKHYDETDLVTYTIEYLREDGTVTTNKRFNVISHTGVYDINYDPNILQTTMNICVKNVDESERILFDENLSLGEDQWFIFSWLLRKQKLGFVKEAVYTYYRHSGSASAMFNNPYYCFEQYTGFLKRLLDAGRDGHGAPHPTAQALVIYNFAWRITGDLLICHIDEETEQKQTAVLRDILLQVDDNIIATSIYVDPYHVEYLMKLKGTDCGTAFNGTSLSACNSDGRLLFTQTLTVSFGVFRIRKDRCIISGYIKNCFVPAAKIKLFCVRNDNAMQEIPLNDTAFNYYNSQTKTNNFGGFDFSVMLGDANSLSFKIKIGDVFISPALQFGFKCAINISKPFAACGDYTVEFINLSKCVVINKACAQELARARAAADSAVAVQSKKALVYRKAYQKRSKKAEVWLYCDREGIFDNAYIQFIHDFGKADGIVRYYVTDKAGMKSKRFTGAQRKYLLEFKSLKHKMEFLGCDKILTSFNSWSVFSPFDGLPLKWYSDLTHYDVIYLQHGILHASLPLMYSKDKANVDKVVISSEFERRNFVDNYGFQNDDLIDCGMSRLDTIDITRKASNRILFSPSWRKSLIGEYVSNTRELMPNRFLASTFFVGINEFLQSKELAELLEKNDLYLDFNNHPIFRDYNEYFQVDNPRIRVSSERNEIQDYLLMITDYSSFVFDFAYLSRPVFYFVPDYDEFKAGITHNYRSLDLPLEEGFGPLTQTAQELVKALGYYIGAGCEPSQPYAGRMADFFLHKDKHCCDRLYDELMKRQSIGGASPAEAPFGQPATPQTAQMKN